jgi:DNA-binding NtrC family response regulator
MVHTILLVDDDDGVRQSIGAMLERSGYAVRKAADGAAALESLREDSAVDLVITDRRMPGMDGLALARMIKERQPGLPVVMMTAYGDLESYLCAGSLGVIRYIGKPVGIRDLQRTVRDAVAEGLCARTLNEVKAGGAAQEAPCTESRQQVP